MLGRGGASSARWQGAAGSIAVGTACVAGGWLAARGALAPGQMAPLAVPAGVALAAGLRWGAAGVACAVLAAFAGAWLAEPLDAALIGAVALALQVALAVVLVRRLLGPRPVLDEPRDIARFAALAAVAAAAGALAAVIGQRMMSPPMVGSAGERALGWWAGQTLSTCAVAPIALAFIGRPRPAWIGRRISVGLTLMLALVLLVGMIERVVASDRERLRNTFEREAQAAAATMVLQLREPVRALQAMRSVFAAAAVVSRAGFAEAARPWLEGPGHQLGLAYHERVMPDALAAFEARWRAGGVPNYEVYDRNADNTVHSRPTAEAYAITYIEPMETRFDLLGLNAMSVPAVRRAIDETVRTGKPIATPTFRLASEPGGPPVLGINAYQVLYDGQPATEAERRAAARGVVSTTVQVHETLKAVTDRLPAAITVCIVDVSPDATSRWLAGPLDCERATPGAAGLTHTESIEFAGRRWELRLSSSRPHELPGARGGDAWWFALAGLLAIALLAMLLLTVTGRATRLRSAVEEARRARVAADAANVAKSEFLANMSHEIRTPMNAIVGMTYLALRSELTPRQHGYISKVQSAAQSLLGIVNDILDFSKIEAGKLAIESTPFAPGDVLETLANLLGLRAEDKGIELLFDLPADLPATLIGDPLRLTQVLTNLGGNAIKFTDAGEVVVRIERLEAAAGVVRLRFSVQDTGIGITAEQRARLFMPFEQADASTTRRYGGTGLGLTISRQLVTLMGGALDVQSQLGQGSVFSFTLDFRASEKTDAEPATATARSSLRGLRALIVDDNLSARTILAEMAEMLGLVTEVAKDGRDALRAVTQASRHHQPFDIVLMDWRMPEMDGVACARALACGQWGPPPVVLMTTAYARDQLREELDREQVPVADVLVKPVTPSVLLDACAAALGRTDPAASRAKVRASALADHRGRLDGARVLLVEDNDINIELAAELLGEAGVVLGVAHNGREAIERLAHETYDIVLMDCQMPVMDGYEATRAIRARPDLRALPIIAMTANAMSGDRELALAAGMNDHIAKPIDVAAMFDTLARWAPSARPPNAT